MKTIYTGPRGTAVKILNRVERTDAYLDKLLDAELRNSETTDVDKSLLAEIVHGVVRWQGRLDWILNGFTHGNFSKSEVNVKNALRVALYQILFLTHVPHYAAVNEAVEFIKQIRGAKLADFVNAVLRNIIRTLDGIHYPKEEEDPTQYLAVYYSHPQWMVRRWLQRFERAELEKLLTANNEIPGLTLRINKLKIQPSEFLALLDKQHVAYQGSSLIDYFIKVRSLSGISQMNIFQNGYFSIQDESAALPVLLLDPRPGESVLDLCAAPGGKTTFIAELMMNKGSVTAIDKYDSKLKLIQTSCSRLGVTNVELKSADAMEVQLPPVDKILVDAPCSGLGVLRKKPDIKWKRQPDDIARLVATQNRVLENAVRLLKPGGVIVYATCTTEPEENILLVSGFLQRHPEFVLDPAGRFVNRAVVADDGSVQTFPHRHQMDGSFAVRLVHTRQP
ncbi:MAG TPA: 16S rRNA (cytosine(967)-C(5))-methyltransferase RsmB [Bacteroidota bacterium]|nr:16S rRNA (cytosine(967)-C(5))-methyltransferase RsmB [Bacteroidota bacterium]